MPHEDIDLKSLEDAYEESNNDSERIEVINEWKSLAILDDTDEWEWYSKDKALL